MPDFVYYIIIVFLIMCSALFSGSEMAIAQSNKIRIKKNAEAGKKSAIIADYIVENFTSSLSTILVGNNLVNIAASSAATVLFIGYFGSKGASIATPIITVLILIFGEIFPKIVASTFADKLIYIIAYPIRILMIVFSPVVFTVTKLVEKIEPIWKPKEKAPTATTEELTTLLETIEEEGVFSESEGELIKSAIEFTDQTARDIMIPRVDIAYYDLDDDLEELLKDEERMSYSRIPVCRENLDDIVGILPTKQIIKSRLRGEEIKIEELLVEPMYVHMTRTIPSILDELRRTHKHVAIVLDEYGGTMGMISLEDILEEIFGEIYDETDETEWQYTIRGENSMEVDGGMNIYDFFDLIEYDPGDFESEYTTLSGWATELLDRFPVYGDTFDYDNMTFIVTDAGPTTVNKLKVEIHPREDEDEE